jgi:hypothetical protein
MLNESDITIKNNLVQQIKEDGSRLEVLRGHL